MILMRVKGGSVRDIQREMSKRGKTRVLPALTRELKEAIKENSERGVGIDGKKNKKYTPKYAKFREKMGLNSSPVDFRVTGSFLDDSIPGKDTLKPKASDAAKASGLMRKRKPYPQQESDIAKKSKRRLELAGEKAGSD